MIRETIGDLLSCNADIICHQVNCKGVMGAGVAKQIKEQLLTTKDYLSYQRICILKKEKCLGNVLYLPSKKSGQTIANCFGENIPTGKRLDTNYNALYKCMLDVEEFARKTHSSVAIPGYMGCGLAGGFWNTVMQNIIRPVFGNSPVDLNIVFWNLGIKDVPFPDTITIEEMHLYGFGKDVSGSVVDAILPISKKRALELFPMMLVCKLHTNPSIVEQILSEKEINNDNILYGVLKEQWIKSL